VHAKPVRVVARSEDLHGIVGHVRGRHLGQKPTVRTPESKRTVGLALALVAFLVDCAVVPSTEQGKVRECGGSALRPVAHVMSLPERQPAARETAAAVAMLKRAP